MIHEFTMENGLKVIGIESHKSPVVSVQMWVRNGSADERYSDEGLSHFIEHLVFKGTQKYKVGEIAAKVESCGGEINAYTSFDQTVFYITISKHFTDVAMEIISQMMSVPTFDPEEIHREREVVIEEIKRGQDSLGRRASRLLFSKFYEDQPYSIPVIGYEKVIKECTPERIRSFFHERYVPDNMFLLITGDFDKEELVEMAEKYFAPIAKRTVKIPARPIDGSPRGRGVAFEKTQFEDAVFYIVWPGTNIFSKDLAALECLSLILGQGASSRLYEELRLKNPLVNSIGAGVWAPAKIKGFFSISGSLNPQNAQAALQGLRAQIEKLFSDGVTAEELRKAKINFLSEESYSLETVGGLANKYGGNFESTGDLYFHEEYHRQLETVTTEDVMRVACQYLQPKHFLLTAVIPEKQEACQEHFSNWTYEQKTLVKPHSASQPVSLQRRKGAEVSEDIQVHTLKKGSRFYFKRTAPAPIFNLRMAFLGGAYVVPEAKLGLAELAGRLWSAQTQNKTEKELKMKTDLLASSVYSFSGRNTFGLVASGLSEFEDQLSEIFFDILQNDKITEDLLAREKKMILESIRSRKDSPAALASLQFAQAMFKSHPYGQDVLGTEETLQEISTEDVRNYIHNNVAQAKMVSAMTGDFSEELWLAQLQKWEQKYKKKNQELHLVNIPELSENKTLYTRADKEQAHVIYGFRAPGITSHDRYILQTIEAVLAGQGGRLFIELRDKASLAYSVSPMRMEGLEAGYFATYIGCSPEKVEKSILMMKEELEKLQQNKISQDELQRAQNYLIGGHDIGLQKNSAISASIVFNEIYGNTYREIYDYDQKIRAVTTEDVQRLSQQIFSKAGVLSVAGPQPPKEL